MTPTLRQLEYLVALARELNFRVAAEACHVTQPALSAQIQQLEATLGVQLFERDKRRVLATAAGAELAARAEGLLRQVDQLVAAARARARPLCGLLRLGVIPTVAPYLLPRVLPAVRGRHPELQLLLREDRTADLVQRLQAGDLDVLLLALEAELGDVETLPLFHDPFVMAAPADHPLSLLAAVPLEALEPEPVLLLEDGHCLRDQALSVCERSGAQEVPGFRATSLSTLVQMVATGLGVTLLPSLALEVEVRAAPRLVVCPFAEPAPGRTIGLAWRTGSARRAEFELLAAALRPGASPAGAPDTAGAAGKRSKRG